eukprot:8875162-Pyramimonas_sp.AAC.1
MSVGMIRVDRPVSNQRGLRPADGSDKNATCRFSASAVSAWPEAGWIIPVMRRWSRHRFARLVTERESRFGRTTR